MRYYITFGQKHNHIISGNLFNKDCVALIEAPAPIKTRYRKERPGFDKAMIIFKGIFHNCFTEDEFEQDSMQFYPRGVISVEPRNKKRKLTL